MTGQAKTGILSAIGAYGIWGVLPIYWKLLESVPAPELMAHRVVWAFFFMLLLLLLSGRLTAAGREMQQLASERYKLAGVFAAAILISINWLIYIWAVNTGRIVESSLGYYINPLVNVLLGILFLGEKLSFCQSVSCVLATAGVLNLIVHLGFIPWVSILLALTFGLYGLCKKKVALTPLTGITMETLLILPCALIFLLYLGYTGVGALTVGTDWKTAGLLLGTGGITAIPLLLFANGARYLPLKLLGFTQYLSPTLALILGIFLYHEPFTVIHQASFALIWLALVVFSLDGTVLFVWLGKKSRAVRQEAASIFHLPH